MRETVDRAELAAAQTPQGFRIALLREAYDAAAATGSPLTDEAMAVERLGRPGARGRRARARNRKITTPDDLAWAEDAPGAGRRRDGRASRRHRLRRAPPGARAAP